MGKKSKESLAARTEQLSDPDLFGRSLKAVKSGAAYLGDDDVIRDHQALQYVGGVVKVPDDFRYKGSDGLDRHGDTGIAGMLVWYASRQGAVEYGYEPVSRPSEQDRWNGTDDDEDERDPWRSPLGAALRGAAF